MTDANRDARAAMGDVAEPMQPAEAMQPAVSRRDSLKLASAVLALGATLGVPAAAMAAPGTPGVLAATSSGRIQLKWYYNDGGRRALLQTVELSDQLAAAMRLEGRKLEAVYTESQAGELGRHPLPQDLLSSLGRLQLKIEFDRTQLKFEAVPRPRGGTSGGGGG
jgi:hypothetical protein